MTKTIRLRDAGVIRAEIRDHEDAIRGLESELVLLERDSMPPLSNLATPEEVALFQRRLKLDNKLYLDVPHPAERDRVIDLLLADPELTIEAAKAALKGTDDDDDND